MYEEEQDIETQENIENNFSQMNYETLKTRKACPPSQLFVLPFLRTHYAYNIFVPLSILIYLTHIILSYASMPNYKLVVKVLPYLLTRSANIMQEQHY